MNEPPGFTDFTIGPLEPSQRSRVAEILRSTENFRDDEVDVALEVFDASFGGDDYVMIGAFTREEGSGMWDVGAAGSEQLAAPRPTSHIPLPQPG